MRHLTDENSPKDFAKAFAVETLPSGVSSRKWKSTQIIVHTIPPLRQVRTYNLIQPRQGFKISLSLTYRLSEFYKHHASVNWIHPILGQIRIDGLFGHIYTPRRLCEITGLSGSKAEIFPAYGPLSLINCHRILLHNSVWLKPMSRTIIPLRLKSYSKEKLACSDQTDLSVLRPQARGKPTKLHRFMDQGPPS